MTNAVAAIGLTYDGIDVQDADLGIFLQITQGLNEGMQVRGRDVVVPSLTGQTARNRKGDTLAILLTGIVRGNGIDMEASRASFRANVRTMRTLFATDRLPALLVAALEDGATATVPCRPNGPAVWNEVVQSEFAYVSVELLAVEDWDYSDVGS